MSDQGAAPPSLTGWQVRRARAVAAWYLREHYGRPGDPGVAAMFSDRNAVGRLAVDPADLATGRPSALFRVLVACSMFQRQRDAQVQRILRGLTARVAREVGSQHRLLRLAAESRCEALASNAALLKGCDLTKDPETGEGTCTVRRGLACHLKDHTVALRRYGHFGKVPTSLALALREQGAGGLPALYRRSVREAAGPAEAAARLEAALQGAWRVSQKLACMFLSVVANPDLGPAPWQEGVDWRRFVVIDSNVDLFLEAVGYRGGRSYDARRSFLQALAARVPLDGSGHRVRRDNPRLLQQALYLFMSTSNRRTLQRDCSHRGAAACRACPGDLRMLCPATSTVER